MAASDQTIVHEMYKKSFGDIINRELAGTGVREWTGGDAVRACQHRYKARARLLGRIQLIKAASARPLLITLAMHLVAYMRLHAVR